MESAARISMALKVVVITAIVAGSRVSPLSIADLSPGGAGTSLRCVEPGPLSEPRSI
jgi:hypothetical protein